MLRETNDFLSIVWKIVGLVLLAVAGVYLAICIIGNISLNRAKTGPAMPSVKNAKYEFTIETTGQQLLTSTYQQSGTIYTLNGYYSLKDNKWIYTKNVLELDSKYFGPIELITRK